MNALARELKQKITDRTATLGVVGLGYVGLPLAREACRAGLRVGGLDLDARVVTGLSAGTSHVDDVSAADVDQRLPAGKIDLLGQQRLQGILIHLLPHRGHHIKGQKERQANHHLIGRQLVGPHGLSKQRKDNGDARK